MVNNSEQIRKMLSFVDKDDFYFIQIFKRRKDNPYLGKDQIVLENFYIDSWDDFDFKLPRIINICNSENARAYIRVNKRNYDDLAKHFLKRAVDIVFSENCKALRSMFDSVAGEFHSDPDRKWIVDIDWDNLNTTSLKDSLLAESKIQLVLEQEQILAERTPLLEKIPTKNGMHFITRPFSLLTFNLKMKEYGFKIDVHKDNPTLLYCP